MAEYNPIKIQAVLNSPNEFNPNIISQMLLDGCFSIEDLRNHGLNDTLARLVEQKLLSQKEDVYYQKCTVPNAKYEDLCFFIDNYPHSVHFNEIKSKKELLDLDKNQYDRLVDSINDDKLTFQEKKQKAINFKETYPFSTFITNVDELIRNLEKEENERIENEREAARLEAEAAEEKRRMEELQKKDEEEWNNILRILTDPAYSDSIDMKMQLLNNYENTYSIHKSEVPTKRDEIIKDRDAMPQIQAVLSDPSSDVIDFLHLIRDFPFKKDFLREFMLSDMVRNPSRYDRVEMNWLLKGKYDDVDNIPPVFTINELLARSIAPLSVLNHIVTHIKDEDDRDPTENQLMPETNFRSGDNNTDIYFFGCPGSGKSAVLAGLFKATICNNLRFNLLMHGGHLGYTYASILKNYLTNKLFPQPTKTKFVAKQQLQADADPFISVTDDANSDNYMAQGEELNSDKFIQIVDAELIESSPQTNAEVVHKLSIIEMPGERTLDFAVADARNLDNMDDLLGEGTKELFKNNNRKVFFIVLDPNPKRAYTMSPNGIPTTVTQKDVLEVLIQFFQNVPGLIEKIDAIHIILAKSDLLKNADDFGCINEIIQKGYQGVIANIKSLCNPNKGNINSQCEHTPYIFTFSLGKVYPGHMLEYNDDDAKKILQLIAANTYSVKTTPTKWESIVEWMNK